MILCGLSNSRCSSGNNNSRNEAAANGGSNSLKVKADKSKLTSSVDLGVLLRYAKCGECIKDSPLANVQSRWGTHILTI